MKKWTPQWLLSLLPDSPVNRALLFFTLSYVPYFAYKSLQDQAFNFTSLVLFAAVSIALSFPAQRPETLEQLEELKQQEKNKPQP